MAEERRSDHPEILVKLAELGEGQKHIKKSLDRIEEKTVSNSQRIGKVEGKVKWMQGIGIGLTAVLGFLKK